MRINFKCEIKGLNELEKKLKQIAKELPKKVEESVEDILKNVRGYAIRLEKGHNENGIQIEMIETSTMKVKGRIYTDKEKFSGAMLEHFGTGASQWFIPVTKVEKILPYPIVEIQGSQLYVARGVHSNHFMTDAEFKTREKNREMIQKQINEMLKEVCRQ